MSDEVAICGVHRLVADVCIVSGGKVLLVKYADVDKYDGQTGWFLPDDFLGHLEHPDQAARRILQEQVGLGVPELELRHIESFGDGFWHLVFHYWSALDQAPDLRPSSDLAIASWFPVRDLPPRSTVAHHGWALRVIKRMMATGS